jgi:hypothetical protein
LRRGHFKAVITKPQNVLVMRDIACGGYVAGCNTRWFVKNETDGTYSLTSAKDNMMKRLSFADDVGSRYGSMLAFPCWGGQFESGALDTVCSITTRLLPWEVTSAMGGGGHSSFPGGDAAYNEYNKKLQLRAVHFGEDMKAAENQEFISQVRLAHTREPPGSCDSCLPFCEQGSTNNATCFVGPHRRYDPFTRSFLSLIPGQGHFGPDAIPGVRSHLPFSLRRQRDSRFCLFPLCSGCPLAPWRVGVAQVCSRRHGRPRACSACPDGLHQQVSSRCPELTRQWSAPFCECVCPWYLWCLDFAKKKTKTPHSLVIAAS